MATERRATHAGSWYSDKAEVLERELASYLSTAAPGTIGGLHPKRKLKAIIGPHAGYSYSGKTAAFGYVDIDPSKISRIFLLGPSHHVYLRGCAVSGATTYQTPLGDIAVDGSVCSELSSTGKFSRMPMDVDEDEHSLEMHLPYIAHVMRGHPFTLVPILVGSVDASSEKVYGELLSRYLDCPSTLFIISSDFCHWGKRFRFTHYDAADGPIHKSIENLDRKGMHLIEEKNPEAFRKYLEEYQNTICGRHPISVFLQAILHSSCDAAEVQFVHYAQSSHCKCADDSSVSYATALCYTKEN
mmetsp:Transcript_11651/g.29668  ORF Transcript_11651/g.29668 Transcript_11651/m.29668 type:complete len:300 (+) Transcript_11651:88-987(+)